MNFMQKYLSTAMVIFILWSFHCFLSYSFGCCSVYTSIHICTLYKCKNKYMFEKKLSRKVWCAFEPEKNRNNNTLHPKQKFFLSFGCWIIIIVVIRYIVILQLYCRCCWCIWIYLDGNSKTILCVMYTAVGRFHVHRICDCDFGHLHTCMCVCVFIYAVWCGAVRCVCACESI